MGVGLIVPLIVTLPGWDAALGLPNANTSRVDLTEALPESQESQISLNRKAIVFGACGNIPLTTADEAKIKITVNKCLPRLICSRVIDSEYK